MLSVGVRVSVFLLVPDKINLPVTACDTLSEAGVHFSILKVQ